MMQKNLTLTMKFSSVQLLKKLAKERKTTPSKIVEEIFRNMKDSTKSAKKKIRFNGS